MLLETLRRSPPGELVLASGLKLRRPPVRGGALASRVWQLLREAQDAFDEDAQSQSDALGAALLAGGGDPAELPAELAAAGRDLPEAARAVVNPLVAIAIEVSLGRRMN